MNRAQGRREEGITLGIVDNGRGREDRSEGWREDRSEGWREDRSEGRREDRSEGWREDRSEGRREDRSEGWREDRSEGRREEGITVHHVCMLLSLHTPHLHHWVTVELNSFVVPLWKQTVSCIMQFVDK